MKRGAEANIYISNWYGRKSISKIRAMKPYRHKSLDSEIRRRRTIHEARMLSASKTAGVLTPFVYFVDPVRSEIVMEFVSGKNAKDVLNPSLATAMGKYAALLHSKNIIHGDLATSNFVLGTNLVILDFGLSFYSERLEDRASDIRLLKEIYGSAHFRVSDILFKHFLTGYSDILGNAAVRKILEKVTEIERRGRYARFS
ncbi:MAG TPA: KEOPS complex kinase/ATPase Bud32 [Candidatus Nitrosopolaris sp.]|nr:KEOPS complex kinase/ATPase Bud32 [Candidatus Nitrosopolaris sp.]